MSEVPAALKQIQDELKELRLLYERLIDRLVPIDEPTEEEKEALESTDKIATEGELFRALDVQHRNKA
jgi:hypothetical protein